MAGQITRLEPAGLPPNADLKNLVVFGQNFATDSVVYFGSTPLTTVFTTPASLSVRVPASVLSAAGTIQVTVHSASTGTSAQFPFTCYSGLPESPHPYINVVTYSITYTDPSNPAYLWVTFDPQTFVYLDLDPQYNDTIRITNNAGFTQDFQGADLAGRTVQIPGGAFTILFWDTPGNQAGVNFGGNFFGFRVIDIKNTQPAIDSYLLGNRNSADQPNPRALYPSTDISPGPYGAVHPSYGGPSSPILWPQILPEAVISTPYNYQFAFPNAEGAVTWTRTGDPLPAGITLNGTTGLLSGTPQPVPTASSFTVTAVDSAGKSATGQFLLRVFRNPVAIADDLTMPVDVYPPDNMDFQWAFPYSGALYAVFEHRGTPDSFVTYYYEPVVMKSADGGLTWTRVNPGDPHLEAGMNARFQAVWSGSFLYFAFYDYPATTGASVPFTVQKYDVTTNSYTPVYTSSTPPLSGGYWSQFIPHPVLRPNGDLVIFANGILASQDPTTHNDQIYMISQGGTVQTKVSNVSDSGSKVGLRVASAIGDSTGAIHLIWSQAIAGTSSKQNFYYCRIGSDDSLGSITLLTFGPTGSVQNRNTGPGHGYVRIDGSEIVWPVALSDPRGLNQCWLGMLHGSPLSAPVFTTEIIDCDINRDTSNQTYFSPFNEGLWGFEDIDGSDVIFWTGFDQDFSDSDYGAIWMVKKARALGSTWSYRDRYYHAIQVPFYPPTYGSDQFTYMVCAFPDSTAPTGYRLFFLANPGGHGLPSASIMLLIYPGPLAAYCNNPPQAYLGYAYSHQFGVSSGVPPYRYEITSGSLPPGLTLDPFTGIVSGTPMLAHGNLAHFDPDIENDFGNPIDSYWESGLVVDPGERRSSMVRFGVGDVWMRGAGPITVSVYGPDKVKLLTTPLRLVNGQPITALTDAPGLMYALKFDLSKVENCTFRFESSALDGWFELSGFRAYFKTDLFNR